jgi:hypothetical protein
VEKGDDMFGHNHVNRVLYRTQPQQGHRYRQLMVWEKEQFEVHMFEGDVIRNDSAFVGQSYDAQIYFHTTLEDALDDVEQEYEKSVSCGWVPLMGD